MTLAGDDLRRLVAKDAAELADAYRVATAVYPIRQINADQCLARYFAWSERGIEELERFANGGEA